MILSLSVEMVTRLRNLASQPGCYEDMDFDLHSASGANIDDAFAMGIDEGMISLAKDLIQFMPSDDDDA